jgi:alkylhydroperoxidase/carboxymuconolactone decarboxylase family protein YurZ
MATHYYDENDLKLLKEMGKLAPHEFKAWADLDKIVAREDGQIPRKYRELIALAVAHTTQQRLRDPGAILRRFGERPPVNINPRNFLFWRIP